MVKGNLGNALYAITNQERPVKQLRDMWVEDGDLDD